MDDKKPKDKSKPKSKPSGGGPPGQEAAPPMGPPVPGMMGPGPAQPPLPGEPIDPFAAMAGSAPPPMAPMGGAGMQGGADAFAGAPMPPMSMGEPDMDDNPMLSALLSGVASRPDMQNPYATLPGESQHVFDGIGVADPQMGLQEMLKLLMLAQAGVAPGSPVTSSSGLVSDPPSNPMAGFSPPGGGVGFGMY